MNKVIICLTILFYCTASNSLSLDEAVSVGLKNSPEYIMERNRLKMAENSKKSTISGFLPDISLNYQTGIKQDIRGDSDTDDDFGNETSESIYLTQPLFNGFKTLNNIKQGEFEYLAEKERFEFFERDLINRIILSYLELYKWQKTYDLTKQNLQSYEIILNQIKNKASYGSNNELIDYKVSYAVAKQELRNIKTNLYKAELEYQDLTGDYEMLLLEPKIEFIDLNLNDLLDKLSDNPEVRQKHYEYLASRSNHKMQVGELLPSVSLEASHTKQSNVVYLSGEDLETKSILLDVTIPIFKQGTRFFNIKESEYNANIKAEEYELTLMKLRREVASKYKEYNFYLNDYNQVYTIYKLLKNKLLNNQESFKLKLLDRVSLLKTKIEKYDAEIEFIKSDVNLYAAYFKIKTLTDKGSFSQNYLID